MKAAKGRGYESHSGSSKRRLRYTAGQYLFLHCPQVSRTEWHPFTISSSPEERTFGVHIVPSRNSSDQNTNIRIPSK